MKKVNFYTMVKVGGLVLCFVSLMLLHASIFKAESIGHEWSEFIFALGGAGAVMGAIGYKLGCEWIERSKRDEEFGQWLTRLMMEEE